MPNLLVECDVRAGLFKTEYLVSIPGSSFYVDREDVRVNEPPEEGKSVKGRVLAYLVEERNDDAVIEMTGTPVAGGLRILVPKTITKSA